MPRNEVAIYSPFSVGHYDAEALRGGGAERQMALLAKALAEQGVTTALVVYRPRSPLPLPDGLSLVVRRPYAGEGLLGPVREAVAIWRSLGEADPEVVVVRTGTPAVGIAALFCRVRRRRLVFSSANDADFTFETVSDRWYRAPVYRLGLRLSDLVVVQSQSQAEAARRVLGEEKPIVRIASFVEGAADPPTGPPEAFLWVGRVVEYKHPLRYLELARELPEARFLMVAAPEDERSEPLLEAVRAGAAELPNVELLEPMPHARLAELVRGAVAVVNTSRLEGMPNVFLEAWTFGRPVLTLAVDPDGVVARERLGVAADGSWDRFVAGARELWERRGADEEASARARAYVEREHGFAQVGRHWADALGLRA
jgi:glycosyltransferase involved in cell wall biosynthesis